MTDATELDEAAVRAATEACLRGFEAEVPAHWYGQADVVARALRKEYGPGGIYDADAAFIVACSPSVVLAALDEITRLRAALDEALSERDEALSDHLCACGYGVVCGQCQRVDRARAEAAEEERDEARAEVAKWESVAEDTLGANKVLLKAMRRADREREAAESALAAVRALADEWECSPDETSFHRRACPGCSRANRLRTAAVAPAKSSADGPDYQPCSHECNGCPTCDPGLATGVTSPDGDRGLSEAEIAQWLIDRERGGWQYAVERILAARTTQPEGVEWEYAFGQKLRRRAPGPWEVVGDE